jgi:hypothetical protein
VSQGQVLTSRTLTPQEMGKAPMQQVFVPKKKKEAPVAPTPKSDPPASITIGSTKVSITNNDGPIAIVDPTPATTQDGSAGVVDNVDKEKRAKRDPKYMQPKWCL